MTFKRANQLILMISDNENGRYCEESGYAPRIYETIADFAVDHDYEECISFIRLDLTTGESEIITSEFLVHWENTNDSGSVLEFEDADWPLFIPDSIREDRIEEAEDEAAEWAKGLDYCYGPPARI